MSLIKRSKDKTQFVARRTSPTLYALDVAQSARDHWETQLTARQRKRAIALLRKSGGRPSNLSKREKRELGGLVHAFDPLELAKRQARMTFGIKPSTKSRFRRSLHR